MLLDLFTLNNKKIILSSLMGAAPICDNRIVLRKKLIVHCRCDSVKDIHFKLLSPIANGPQKKRVGDEQSGCFSLANVYMEILLILSFSPVSRIHGNTSNRNSRQKASEVAAPDNTLSLSLRTRMELS